MSFLDAANWKSNILLDGWRTGGAGDAPVMEPATGQEIARSGRASVGDVAIASARAISAQREWAAKPFTERSAVLRRAGQLFQDHAEEISDWIVRESGGIGPKAGLEIHVAAEECSGKIRDVAARGAH